ncbi:MAG: ribose-5-phosphate isomerase RpiA [Caldilinea sp.]|uniref:ribose-5-phosphate isomerase RpiA n=1 Tax=Caldilinea sp. TaxID=2293560 RepID=UPI002BB14D86|nr:ribose-5-phosphate isomerase RpiA [Caldilinea sp.]HRA67178.1 ribose-5-phosphate isomerase RpiA [Caldilinea sp.]
MTDLTASTTADAHARLKREAGEYAVRFVESGMVVGLGTGSTAIYAVRRLGALLKQGALRDIVGFATSTATLNEARALGIPLLTEELPRAIDITIDGADEVDPAFNVIKGGGGALLREKIVAQASRRLVIVVDERKLSPQLGVTWPVPLEVMRYGYASQARFLASLGGQVDLRLAAGGSPYVTDNDNWIVDCHFGPIDELDPLARALEGRAGIVEHGLFLHMATDLVIAGADGVRYTARPLSGSDA